MATRSDIKLKDQHLAEVEALKAHAPAQEIVGVLTGEVGKRTPSPEGWTLYITLAAWRDEHGKLHPGPVVLQKDMSHNELRDFLHKGFHQISRLLAHVPAAGATPAGEQPGDAARGVLVAIKGQISGDRELDEIARKVAEEETTAIEDAQFGRFEETEGGENLAGRADQAAAQHVSLW